MVSITKRSGNEAQYLNEYVLDTAADVANLPKDCAAGSTAVCIATSEVYMMNSDKEWKKL